jgi:hypothetical protein
MRDAPSILERIGKVRKWGGGREFVVKVEVLGLRNYFARAK